MGTASTSPARVTHTLSTELEDYNSQDRRAMAWRGFLLAHASVVGELERDMQEHQGHPLVWYDILVNLECAPECRLRMQALADSIFLSRSGLTRLLDRMAAAGLVCREPCPEDRRGTYASLTDLGRQALVDAAPGHEAGIERHFLDSLSDDDIEALIVAFGKVSGAPRVQPGGERDIEPVVLEA